MSLGLYLPLSANREVLADEFTRPVHRLDADRFRKGRQPLGQRGVHVTGLLEYVLERR